MIFLDNICSILRPNFDDEGNIVFEDLGDCFCRIQRRSKERHIPGYYTHKALIEMNGANPGDLLVTTENKFLITFINKEDNLLGLIEEK